MSKWVDILTVEELDALYALTAKIDPSFARQDREWWESRSIAQLSALKHQAWLTNDADQFQRAGSYLARGN